jgi:hypothetical protein
MKEITKGLLLPAPNAQSRHRQARRIPANLNKKIEQFWKDKGGVGESKIINGGDDAIKNYTFTTTAQGVRVVYYIRAEIHQRHFGRPRKDFPKDPSDRRMEELGSLLDDDKGHILAFSLGTHNTVENMKILVSFACFFLFDVCPVWPSNHIMHSLNRYI